MELGLNLSFAVKRWTSPGSLGELLAGLHERHGVTRFQFSFDQVDPWWPVDRRAAVAKAYRTEFGLNGLTIDSAFGGLAAYAFPNLLAPLKEQRDSGLELFKRSLDTTLELGATAYGSPIGRLDAREADDQSLRELRYRQAVEAYHALAEYAARAGITELMVEPTPVAKELLHTPEGALRFAEDTADAAVPVNFLVDWGHAICAPFGDLGSMATWVRALGDRVVAMHLQQTDGFADRHWAFDVNGLVTTEVITGVATSTGTDHLPQYLEYIPLFEDEDDVVVTAVEESLTYLAGAFRG